jgi:hypothetical protein
MVFAIAGTLVSCVNSQDGSASATYLRAVRANLSAEADLTDAQLLSRAHLICAHIKPGNPPTWRMAVAYVAALGVPTNQAWHEVDYASALYCPGKRSSMQYPNH